MRHLDDRCPVRCGHNQDENPGDLHGESTRAGPGSGAGALSTIGFRRPAAFSTGSALSVRVLLTRAELRTDRLAAIND